MRILSVGIVRARDDSCNNAAEGRRGARHRPSVRRGSRPGHTYGPAVVVAHAATGRADAAKHGHAPDGSSSATPSPAAGRPGAPWAGISTGSQPPTPSGPHDAGVHRMQLARLRTTAQDRWSAGIGGSGKWRGPPATGEARVPGFRSATPN